MFDVQNFFWKFGHVFRVSSFRFWLLLFLYIVVRNVPEQNAHTRTAGWDRNTSSNKSAIPISLIDRRCNSIHVVLVDVVGHLFSQNWWSSLAAFVSILVCFLHFFSIANSPYRIDPFVTRFAATLSPNFITLPSPVVCSACSSSPHSSNFRFCFRLLLHSFSSGLCRKFPQILHFNHQRIPLHGECIPVFQQCHQLSIRFAHPLCHHGGELAKFRHRLPTQLESVQPTLLNLLLLAFCHRFKLCQGASGSNGGEGGEGRSGKGG